MAYISFQPNDYFNTKIYTGTGSSNALTGVGFQPDWTWIKVRSEANNHEIYDAVRGVTKRIYSDINNAEDTNTAGLTAFGTDGFTVNTGGAVNGSSKTYVAWNWKANGQGSSNTDGSINTTYTSANTTAGFSIVKYTNPSSGSPFTVGHGLGAAPKMIIIKNLSSAQTWGVYHASVGFGKYLRLDDSAAEASANLVTATSNTTFSAYQDHHSTGNELIAYCFAEKKGFSKFGSYIGNGNANGAFVYTGFKPAFVIVKRVDSAANWVMTDNKISFNGKGTNDSSVLFPSTTTAETDAYGLQLHSTGFKFAGSDSASATVNGSGAEYIYMAFASEPLVSSNGIPATAR